MSKKSIGGINEKLLFYKTQDVIYDPNDSEQIRLKQGAIPMILDCVAKTVSYELVPGEIDGETFYTPTINAVVSDLNVTNLKNITQIHRNECICFFETKTSKKMVIGLPFTPIKLEVTPKISETHSFNGISIKITSNQDDILSIM